MGIKFPIACAVSPSATSDSYAPYLNCLPSTNYADEGSAETPFFVAGTLSYLYANIWANAATATSNPVSRKNGANGNMALSIPAGATGTFVDSVNSDTVANGDVACIFLDRGGGGAIQFGVVGAYYETDSGVIINKVGVAGNAGFATGTAYFGFMGDMTAVTDNSAGQTPRITVGATVRNFHAYSNSNGRTNTTTFRTRINGANGNCVVTFAAASTGLRTDTTNSDTLAASDNFNYQRVTAAGSGTFVARIVGCEIHYPANEANLFSCDNGGTSVNATAARFMVPSGAFAFNGSESAARIRLFGSGVLSDFYYNVSANASTADATVDVRIGSVSTAITTTLPTTATGTRSNTANTATFTDTQFLNYRYIKPSGTGSTTFRWFSMKITFDMPLVDDFIPQAIWFN